MNPPIPPAIEAYREALRRLPKSPGLDSRIADSIRANAFRRRRSAWFWPGLASLAAAAAAIGWLTMSADQMRSTVVAPETALASSSESPWAIDTAVVRVRGRLATEPGERQYWLDVRISNDGSMRIVRVLPVQPTTQEKIQ